MKKSNLDEFAYKQVAKADADMWRSYYNHQFFKMFIQLLKILKGQVKLNWFLTFKMAYYSAMAAAEYRIKKGSENEPRVVKNLTKFYKIISDHTERPFDYKKAAELEYEWWQVHRYPKKYKKDLAVAVAEPMAVVYHVSLSKLKSYGRFRAEAMLLPQHTGDRDKQDPDKLYQSISSLLEKSWRELYQAVQK
jgi:hypothetical protein